jgi:RNA polymerase sigma-70 factor (ECF subfamily)
MTRFAAGDKLAFNVVYDFVAPRLAAFAGRRIRNRAYAEDLVQQTFVRMIRFSKTFIPGADVLPWARRTLQNLIADPTFRRRTLGREVMNAFEPQWDSRALTATFASGDQELEARHSEHRLRAALARLTPARRAAFEYVKGDGLSCEEAAALLGTTSVAVRIRVHHVVKALRKALESED